MLRFNGNRFFEMSAWINAHKWHARCMTFEIFPVYDGPVFAVLSCLAVNIISSLAERR